MTEEFTPREDLCRMFMSKLSDAAQGLAFVADREDLSEMLVYEMAKTQVMIEMAVHYGLIDQADFKTSQILARTEFRQHHTELHDGLITNHVGEIE
jgi:hypothetical protein